MSRRNLERHLLAAATLQYGPAFRFTRVRFARYCFPPDYDYPNSESEALFTDPIAKYRTPGSNDSDSFVQICTCCSNTPDTSTLYEDSGETHFSETFSQEICDEKPTPNTEPCKLHMKEYLEKQPWRKIYYDYAIHSVQFTVDGKKLIAGCENNGIRVIDTADGKQNFTPIPSRASLGMPVTTLRFMPTKLEWVLGCHPGGHVFAFKPEEEGFETIIKEPQQTYTFDISPDGKELVTGGSDRQLRMYTLRPDSVVGLPTSRFEECLYTPVDYLGRLGFVSTEQPDVGAGGAFPGGRPDQIVDKTTKPYEVAECYSIPNDSEAPGLPEPAGYVRTMPPLSETRPTYGHSRRIMALRYHPQKNSILVSASWDNLVKIWDTRYSHGPVWRIFGPHVASPDGLDIEDNSLLTASWRAHNSVEIWDMRMLTSSTGVPDCHQGQGDSSSSTPRSSMKDTPSEVIPVSGKCWGTVPSRNTGEYVYAARILPSRAVVVGGSGFYEVRIVGRDTHAPVARVPMDSTVQALDVILEGRYVAAGCTSGTVGLIGLV